MTQLLEKLTSWVEAQGVIGLFVIIVTVAGYFILPHWLMCVAALLFSVLWFVTSLSKRRPKGCVFSIIVLFIVFGFFLSDGKIVGIRAKMVDRIFYTDEELALSDFIVTGIRKDGKDSQITGFLFEPQHITEGRNEITIKYNGLSTNIVVDAINPVLEALEVTPIKDNYYIDENFSDSDFTVFGIYSNGDRKILEDFSINPTKPITEGNNNITFTYGNVTKSTNIKVIPHKVISLEAEYIGPSLWEGDTLINEDFRVVETLDNEKKQEINDFELQYDDIQEGENLITVTKDGVSQKITLVAQNSPTGEATIEPSDVFNELSIDDWDRKLDYDISGTRHKKGKKFTISEMWVGVDPNENGGGGDVRTLHLFIPLKKDGDADNTFNGTFVLHHDMKNKKTYGEVKIIVADEVVYSTGPMNSDTRDPFAFSVDCSNVDSLEIQAECHLYDVPFVFGIVED